MCICFFKSESWKRMNNSFGNVKWECPIVDKRLNCATQNHRREFNFMGVFPWSVSSEKKKKNLILCLLMQARYNFLHKWERVHQARPPPQLHLKLVMTVVNCGAETAETKFQWVSSYFLLEYGVHIFQLEAIRKIVKLKGDSRLLSHNLNKLSRFFQICNFTFCFLTDVFEHLWQFYGRLHTAKSILSEKFDSPIISG